MLRDIGALRDGGDEGFVIYSEPGRRGGLQLDPLSAQANVRLSVAEVSAILISVASMRAAGNLPFADLANAGLAKSRRPYRRIRYATCAGFWIVCMSELSLRRSTHRKWGDGPRVIASVAGAASSRLLKNVNVILLPRLRRNSANA